MYYVCPACGKKYKIELDLMTQLGADFGKCPLCGTDGTFVKESPRRAGDEEYEEID